MSNVLDIKKLNNFKKKVITFDKKGNKKEQTVDVNDMYLVTLKNGDQIALSEKQLKYYNVKLDTKSNNKVKEIEEDLETDDIVDNDGQFLLPLITNSEQVTNSLANKE